MPVSAFANCGRAVAHVRGYVPATDSCTAANSRQLLARARARLREFEVRVEFRSTKKRAQSAIFRPYFKNRQLPLRHGISVSNRVQFRVEFEFECSSTATLSMVTHLSLQMDQGAMEIEKCDEESFVGYGESSSVGHSRSGVGR